MPVTGNDAEELSKGMADLNFSPFRLPLVIEQVEDGTYLASSPALEGFLVQADTVDEVIALAPGIAKALLDAMREKGVPIALATEELHFPLKVDVLVG